MDLEFIIQKWSAWPPQKGKIECESIGQEQSLTHVPKMLKRRLSPLARTVFYAANQCIDEKEVMPVVFSSSHGELCKSFAMMEQLQAGEEISPTAFSLSVHNAIAGLFSMVWRNKLESTVIASGEDGMAPAFIEGLGLLAEGAEQVLLVFYDEPIVDFFPVEPYRLATDERCALALRIGKCGEGLPMQLCLSSETGGDGEQPFQLSAFVEFLESSSSSLTIRTPRHSWRWEKYVQVA